MSKTLEMVLNVSTMSCAYARRAATEAFGIHDQTMTHAVRNRQDLTLMVTLEQFGLFVATRCLLGGTNYIQNLQPKIIPHPRQPTRLDCTDYRIAA